MMDEEDNVYQDWLEFKIIHRYDETCEFFANFKRSEIVAVFDDDNKDKCSILLKNGKEYTVKMPYNRVVELV